MENTEVNLNENNVIKQVSAPLFSSKGWMKFVGIMLIITGVFYAISIVGIVIAWIPIWLGILLIGAANRLDAAHNHGDKYSFIEAQTKIGSFFTISGVLMLISLLLTIVFIGIAISSGFLVEYITHMEQSF